MSEKRNTDRHATRIVARLVNGTVNIPCTILDMSPTGARIEIAPGLFLPKLLFLKARELGADRTVEVMWRNKTQVGVRF